MCRVKHLMPAGLHRSPLTAGGAVGVVTARARFTVINPKITTDLMINRPISKQRLWLDIDS